MNMQSGFIGSGHPPGRWTSSSVAMDDPGGTQDHTGFPSKVWLSGCRATAGYSAPTQQNVIPVCYSRKSTGAGSESSTTMTFCDQSQPTTHVDTANLSRLLNMGSDLTATSIHCTHELVNRPSSSSNHFLSHRLSLNDTPTCDNQYDNSNCVSNSRKVSRRPSSRSSLSTVATDVPLWHPSVESCTTCDMSTTTASPDCTEIRDKRRLTYDLPTMIPDNEEHNDRNIWESDCHTGDHNPATHSMSSTTVTSQPGLLYPHVMLSNVGFATNSLCSNPTYPGSISGDCTNSGPIFQDETLYNNKQQEKQHQHTFTTHSGSATLMKPPSVTELTSPVIVDRTPDLQLVPNVSHINPLAPHSYHGCTHNGFIPLTHASFSPSTCMVPSSLYLDTLSMTIWHFFTATRQSQAKYAQKLNLRNALHMVVSGVFENAGLFIVGSSMNGFGSDQSDMDMCLTITSQELQQKKEAFSVLSQLLSPLRKCSFIRNLHLIRAKVPILKFRDALAGVDCDLNVNNVVGIYNTHLLAMYTRIDWRVRPLGMFVKYWAQRMDVHDGSRGRLSTYPLLLMLIHYLQFACSPPVLPNLQAKFPKLFNYARPLSELDMALELPFSDLRSTNPATLGELFVGFIHYYNNEFDFTRWAVSILHSAPLPIDIAIRRLPPHEQAHTARCFKVFVEEPFCQNNAARSLYDDNVLTRIRQAFLKTYQTLRSHRSLDTIWVNSSTESI